MLPLNNLVDYLLLSWFILPCNWQAMIRYYSNKILNWFLLQLPKCWDNRCETPYPAELTEFLNGFLDLFVILCIWVFHLHEWSGVQKENLEEGLDPLGLELQTILSCHVATGNQTWVLSLLHVETVWSLIYCVWPTWHVHRIRRQLVQISSLHHMGSWNQIQVSHLAGPSSLFTHSSSHGVY